MLLTDKSWSRPEGLLKTTSFGNFPSAGVTGLPYFLLLWTAQHQDSIPQKTVDVQLLMFYNINLCFTILKLSLPRKTQFLHIETTFDLLQNNL